jgi:LmbE family N-acetylglucosaminyl deacetylase
MKNVCLIISHVDDEILSCSGIIAKIDNLHIIYTSSSDYMDFDGTIQRTKEESKKERIESLKKLNKRLPVIYDLDYPTKCVPYNSEIIEKIDRILRENNIDTVFTHSPSDTHSDHSNTGRAVFTAARRIPNLYIFEPVFPAQLSTIFQPNTYIDISDIYNKKISALKAQQSQYKRYGKKWLDSVDALSRLRGIESNCMRAECVTTIKQRIEL